MSRRKNQLIISRAKLDYEDFRIICNYSYFDAPPYSKCRADYLYEDSVRKSLNCNWTSVFVKVRDGRRG